MIPIIAVVIATFQSLIRIQVNRSFWKDGDRGTYNPFQSLIRIQVNRSRNNSLCEVIGMEFQSLIRIQVNRSDSPDPSDQDFKGFNP